MNELKGKVAIITGASKGIGAAIARQFGAAGAAVVVNYASSRADADKVVSSIIAEGGKAFAVQADMSKTDEVKRLFSETQHTFGRLDILVNNAGVFSFQPLEAVTEAEFHRQFDINVLGTLLAIQEAVGHFGPQGGSIINFSSISSINPVPNSAIYSASKSAVDALTKALANELAARKIRVNAIAPGVTATEGLAAAGVSVGSDAAQAIAAGIPMGRLGQPGDIAQVALFLASEQSSWLTGERITAAGGQR